MKCAACNAVLEIFVHAGEEMYVCPRCLSVLVSEQAAGTLLRHFCDEALLQRFVTALVESKGVEAIGAMVGVQADIFCPQCKMAMRHYDFNNRTAFYVNYCVRCRYLWITAAQVPLVVLSLQGDTPEDRAYFRTLETLYRETALKKRRMPVSLSSLLDPYLIVPLAMIGFAMPVGDNVLKKSKPWATLGLIGACCAAAGLQMAFPDKWQAFCLYAGTAGKLAEWYRFVTHAFLHGGLVHLAGNMWFLWLFGRGVEDRMGRLPYLLLFLVTAIGSGILYAATAAPETVPIPCVGASGAISGVIAAYLILLPGIKLNFVLRMGGTVWSAPASAYILGWIALNLAFGLIDSHTGQGGVAYWGHVGGFIAGIIFAEIFKSVKFR